jgi:hypothetical protein
MWQWERRGIGIERIHLFPGKELLAMWEGLDFPTNICEIVLIKDNGVNKQEVAQSGLSVCHCR